jgi:hypothetical protein
MISNQTVRQESMQELKPAITEEIFRLPSRLITGGYRAVVNHSLYFHVGSAPIICLCYTCRM